MDDPSAHLLSMNARLSSYIHTQLTVSLSPSFCLMGYGGETGLPLSSYISLVCWGGLASYAQTLEKQMLAARQ